MSRLLRLGFIAFASAGVLAGGILIPAASAGVDPDLSRYVFDLSSLYSGPDAFDADRAAVAAGIRDIGAVSHTLGRSAADLAGGLDRIAALRSRVTRMAVYASLCNDLDSESGQAQRQYDAATALETRVESAVAFLADAVSAIGEPTVRRWLDSEPRLARHRMRLARIFHDAPHRLAAPEEALLASMAAWPRVSADAFWALHESDLSWPVRPGLDGQPAPVTLSNFRNGFPADRAEEAAESFFARLRGMEKIFGLLYTRRIEADRVAAGYHRFESGIDALWWLRDGFPEGTFRAILDASRSARRLLPRMVALRGRALGIRDGGYSSLFTAPPDGGRRYSIREAVAAAVAASEPLGKDFQDRLARMIEAGWMHLPPAPAKRPVFEIFALPGGAHPFMLYTYRGNYRSSQVFTGAVLDMMKDADVPADQASDTRDDPPVYGNGIIYVGEMLHDDWRAAHASSRAEKIAALVSALDVVRRNFFDVTALGELDERVEKLVAAGAPPTGAEVSALYLQILRETFGRGEGNRGVPDAFGAAWMAEPVPFLSYEHQFWAGSVAAAARIVEGLRQGSPDARRAVHGLLGHVESDRSHPLLLAAGIDLTRPDACAALIRRTERLCDELERALSGS